MAQRFGRYWLQEKIGHGGMAEVFRATIGPDPNIYAFEIAVKRLHPQLQSDRATVDMFLTEADVAKLLRHPNIVQVYEAGIIEHQTYIAMEYVWGSELATLVDTLRQRRLRFPAPFTAYVGLQVLRALDYIHGARSSKNEPMNIVHRDVTPSNVYVTFDGRVKLGDFGIARVSFLEERDESMLKGKAAYMPPEVLAGDAVDQRVDLWGVAVTLWEMLTARRLYGDAPAADIVSGAAELKVEPAHVHNPDVPAELSRIVRRALDRRPRRRPRDAVEMYRELKLYLQKAGGVPDAGSLGRFVGSVVGHEPRGGEVRPQAPEAGVFEQPAFQVPMGPSPTQRFAVVRRRRRLWPTVVVSSAVALAAAGALTSWWLLARRDQAVAGGVAAPPAGESAGDRVSGRGHETAATEAGALGAAAATGAAVRRARPARRERFEADASGSDAAVSRELPASGRARFEALMQRGRAHLKRQRFAAAEASFREAIALRPRSVAALLGRANVLLELDRHAEAEALVRSALAVDPNSARGHLLLGDVLWMDGRDKAAREAYQRCSGLDPRGSTGATARRILAGL